ncbi:MAG: tetratricopeptide repeat protein [Prevotella sp.]|jgi:tetratricopeptide (TPR) repeat protein
MKKLMIAAMLLLGASTAFAGDSDALKAVKKAKTYAEAEALVKQNLNSFANNKEKAAAYNHLVDLAIEFYNAQNNTMAANELAAKSGQALQPVDTVGMYDAAYNAVVDAMECAKYDNMPDEKGKVKPKFQEANTQRVTMTRLGLVNAGQTAAQKSDAKGVVKYWGLFLDTENTPFVNKETEKEFLGQVALYAAFYASQLKMYDKANAYCDIALKDPTQAKDALNLKVQMAGQNLKTHEDSVKFVSNMETLYQQHPESDMIFEQLANLYRGLNMNSKVDELLNDKFSKDPNNLSAWFLKGRLEEDKKEYDKAIESFKKCISINDQLVIIHGSLASAIINKAALVDNDAQRKALYKDAITYLEKARQMDPNQEQISWAYVLYQCYYNVYGANDSRTKELEALTKQ